MNNSCPGEELIADYLQGSLPDDKKAELEAHFADCHICLDELITLNAVGLEVDAEEPDTIPDAPYSISCGTLHGRRWP